MDTTQDNIIRLAKQISNKKLEMYTQLLRKALADSGVSRGVFDNAVQMATLELEVQESRSDIVQNSLKTYENRGIDTVGRLVVEYCFIRSPQGKMIWPEYSDEDTMARWQFSDSVIPRPLMRYFLVSVRGTLEGIDEFSSQSFLFEKDSQNINAIHQTISDLIEEFKGPFGSGESSVDWQTVYEDDRFKALTLDIITTLRGKMNESGLDGYLGQLKAYHEIDPKSDEVNLMQRAFTLEDVQQIEAALRAAELQLDGGAD